MAAKIGGKTIETRHWTTAVRGTVYIQAAGTKRGIKDCEQIDPEHRAAMEAALKIPFRQWKDRLPFGALVARGNLSSVLPSREALRLRPSQEPFGNFSPGRYGWIFDGIESLKPPIHCKGAQGFFRVSLPHSITREVTP